MVAGSGRPCQSQSGFVGWAGVGSSAGGGAQAREFNPVLSGCLGPVQRAVGVLQGVLPQLAGFDPRGAHAEGDGPGQQAAGPLVRVVGQVAQFKPGPLARKIQDDQELLAAPAGSEIGAAEAVGQGAQDPVTFRMPELIVQGLEVVHVSQRQQVPAVTAAQGVQAVLPAPAVEQAGQGVRDGQGLQGVAVTAGLRVPDPEPEQRGQQQQQRAQRQLRGQGVQPAAVIGQVVPEHQARVAQVDARHERRGGAAAQRQESHDGAHQQPGQQLPLGSRGNVTQVQQVERQAAHGGERDDHQRHLFQADHGAPLHGHDAHGHRTEQGDQRLRDQKVEAFREVTQQRLRGQQAGGEQTERASPQVVGAVRAFGGTLHTGQRKGHVCTGLSRPEQ